MIKPYVLKLDGDDIVVEGPLYRANYGYASTDAIGRAGTQADLLNLVWQLGFEEGEKCSDKSR